MSVVCAKKYDNRIEFAADSIMVRGWTKDTSGDHQKLEEINGMVLGSVGLAETSSLMWHYMQTHKPLDATEADVLDFIIEFYQWKKNLTGVGNVDSCFILGYKDKAFYIEDFFVCEIRDYCAIGAGKDYALSALKLGHTSKEAVQVSCDLCCMVAEPIIEKTIFIGK